MLAIGEKSNKHFAFQCVALIISTAICIYFGHLCFRYYKALFITENATVLAETSRLMDMFTFGYGINRISPEKIGIVALLVQVEMIFSLSKKLTQPYTLIEYDEKGFYLNLPFRKTWCVFFEEVIAIKVSKYDFPLRVRKRNANLYKYDPDDYVELDTVRMMDEKSTGTIEVFIKSRSFKVSGVKNALQVARKMQVICNDGRRKRFEWLDKKAQERREKELRENAET